MQGAQLLCRRAFAHTPTHTPHDACALRAGPMCIIRLHRQG